MAAFLSKVFPRKKDKETSNKRNSASSLLEGRFEAVSPTVSPSAAHFSDSAQQLKERGREKEKEKDSGFSLFRPRSRPVSPPPDTRKTAKDAPHLTLNLPVPKEQRSRALGVVFEADPNDTSTLPDNVIGERRLTPLETLVLIKACSQAIVDHGGLETLGVMHPFWYSASPEVQRKLISLFVLSLAPKSPITTLSPSPSSATTNFATELEYTRSPHDIAAVLRWALRHLRLEGDSFGHASGQWNWYQAFAEAERTSSYPSNAFTTALVPQIPPSHHQLLVATLDIVSSLASHAEHNSISGSKLSKFLGLWLLTVNRSEDGEDWNTFYARWERAGRILEHLFLAHIRDETLHGKMPLRLTELVKGYPYHSRSPSADSPPAADDDLLPRPRFSTRQYSALFVRVETELPDAKAAKAKPHPLRIVSDALKSEVELTDAQHQRIWDALRAAARAKDDAEPILASVDGYPSLSRIFADETTRLLSFVPAESDGQGATVPTIRVPRPSRRRSSSLNSPTQPHTNGNGNGKAEVNGSANRTPVSPTSPTSPTSPKDWSDFSTGGFGESTLGKDFAKTLLDADVEVTTPPPDNKKSKSSNRRSSVDSPSSVSSTRVAQLAVPPSPKPAKSKSTIVSLVKLDEAFVDFWHDALRDPVAADWPNFIVAQLKAIPGVEHDGKPVSWLVLEQRFVSPPPPPQTATKESAASPTGARARGASPRPSLQSDMSSRRSSTFSAAKKRFTFFASASHTITGATVKSEPKSAARKKPAKISELGEILPEVEEKPEEKPVVPEKEEPKKEAAPASAPKAPDTETEPSEEPKVADVNVPSPAAAEAPSPTAPLSPVTPTAEDFPAIPVVSVLAAAAVVTPVAVEALKTENAPADAALEHKLEVPADTSASTDKSLPPTPEPVVLAGETPGPQVALTTSEPAALVEISQKADEAAPAAPVVPEAVSAPETTALVADVSATPEPTVEEHVVAEVPVVSDASAAVEKPVVETAPVVEEPAVEEPAAVEPSAPAPAPAPAEPAPASLVEPESAPAEAEPAPPEAPVEEPSAPVVEEVAQPAQESAPAVEEPAVVEAPPAPTAAPEPEPVIAAVEAPFAPAAEPEVPVAAAEEESAAAVEEPAVEEAYTTEPAPVEVPVAEVPAVPVEPVVPGPVEETPAVEEARAVEPAPAEEPAAVEEPVAAPVVEESAAPAAEEPTSVAEDAPAVEEAPVAAAEEALVPKIAEEPAMPESASVEPLHAPFEETAPVEESAPVPVGEPTVAGETAAVEVEESAAPAETTTEPAEVVEKHENGITTEPHDTEEKPVATEESQ
ncbi:hypothetical protein LXA43DRAFT_1014163 [Ganoderma leucocontextum]|nr:hypothetical protein LXA43DRAFT_1014163 [Ganoderma leucocontextum]